MAVTTRPKSPRALGHTGRWIEPGSRSAALWARAQQVLPGGNTRTTVYMAPSPDLRGLRRGLLDHRRRGRPAARLPQQLHLADPRPRAPRDHGGGDAPSRARRVVPVADARGDRAGGVLAERVPAVDQVRFTNSGSEAVMMAIKARARVHRAPEDRQVRGRLPRLLRLRRGELVLRARGLGHLAAPASTAYSRGTPPAVLEDVVVLPFNDPGRRRAHRAGGRSLAAVLIDPCRTASG